MPSQSTASVPRAFAFLTAKSKTGSGQQLTLVQQLLLQVLLLFIAVTVLFPIVWIVSMSLRSAEYLPPDRVDHHPPPGPRCSPTRR